MKDKKGFNESVKKIFYPVFPLLAEYFLNQSGHTQGVCLDLGAGNGYLGLALAEKSNLQVRLVDFDSEMLEFAGENVKERHLEDRVDSVLANVEALPFKDNYAQLIVSRGSIFFWENQAAGLNEVYRVLAPGGMSFIGGGFATPELMEEVKNKMQEKDPGFGQHIAERIGPDAPDKFREVLRKTGIPESNCDVSYDHANLWIVIKK
jgi:ubiquinone/menaquinone biosynthesis C-methylase UbiE